jgi:hypothetical protein
MRMVALGAMVEQGGRGCCPRAHVVGRGGRQKWPLRLGKDYCLV